MLGFGAAGTALSLGRKRLAQAANWLVPLLMIISGGLMAIVFPISRAGIMRFDVFLLFSGGEGFAALILNYLIFFVPFFFGALAIGIIFMVKSNEIGTYYFANLAGSGAGGIIVLVFMAKFMPIHLPALIGALPVVAGLLLSNKQTWKQNLAAGLFSMLLIVLLVARPGQMNLSEYKDIALARQLPGTETQIQKPSAYGFTEVVYAPMYRFAPALSLTFDGDTPGGHVIFVNGNYFGHVLQHNKTGDSHLLNYTTMNLPFVLGPKNRILNINAGTGTAVSHALSHNVAHIDAIIENRSIISLLKNELRYASGEVLLHPAVHVYHKQTRNFLANAHSDSYDLIILPLMSEFGGGAGLNALREDYDLTVEAFREMIRTLKPQGMISISTWIDHPPRYSLRILATLAEAAEQSGILHPQEHIAAVRSWGTITFLLKKSPLTLEELHQIRKFSLEMQFDPLVLPGIRQAEQNYFNQLNDTTLFNKAEAILRNHYEYNSAYLFDISPPTDDMPFFSNFIKISRLAPLSEHYTTGQLPFLELGFFTLLATLSKSAILAVMLIIIPLAALKRKTQGKTGTLLYFGSLGLGYMFVEIILIQKFVLYLGQPIYAVVAVVSTMMLSSGLGSLYSQRFRPIPATIAKVGFTILLLLTIMLLFLTPMLQQTLAVSMTFKTVISFVAIGIPAFVMGMMFPLGIRLLNMQNPVQVPWAWGINACFSVVSTSAATIISIEAGFQAVILTAIIVYFAASIAFFISASIRKWFH